MKMKLHVKVTDNNPHYAEITMDGKPLSVCSLDFHIDVNGPPRVTLELEPNCIEIEIDSECDLSLRNIHHLVNNGNFTFKDKTK